MVTCEEDKRVSLARMSSDKTVTLKNIHTGSEETFKIDGEKGRGSSCIVYEASNCTVEGRKVLLKEFYPRNQDRAFTLIRDPKTFALKLDSERKRGSFQEAKDKFLEICRKQMNFYSINASEHSDELTDIQGIYNFGDTYVVMSSFCSGESWDMIDNKDESLYEIFETTLSLLNEVKLYHENNLLYGDIKPANVYVYKKTRQHVKLLDFGSVLELKDGCLTGEETLSYSKEFVSPELLDADEADYIDREDYFGVVTAKADIFSVGALLYKKITGNFIPRSPNNFIYHDECAEAIKHLNIPVRMKDELIDLFKGILEENPDYRFDLEEVEKRLQILRNYSSSS